MGEGKFKRVDSSIQESCICRTDVVGASWIGPNESKCPPREFPEGAVSRMGTHAKACYLQSESGIFKAIYIYLF